MRSRSSCPACAARFTCGASRRSCARSGDSGISSSKLRSLRARLFVSLVGGGVLLCLVAGFALTWTVAVWLQREFDRGLEAKARALVALTEEEGGDVEFEFQSAHMPEYAEAAAPEYFELWLADGTLIARSPSFEVSAAARAAALVRTPGLVIAPAFQDLRLPDGRWGRQIRIDFVPRPDDEDDPAPAPPVRAAEPAPAPRHTVTVILARERERFDADVRRLNAGVGI